MVKLIAKPPLEVAQARASRIKQLRRKLNLSRDKFCKRYGHYGFTKSALQGWENCRWNGLTENGANLLALAFQEAGIEITAAWLLFGIGKETTTKILQTTIDKTAETQLILSELKLFQQHNLNTIHTIIADDALAPWCSKGDYVAGKIVFGEEIDNLLGYPAIVQTLQEGSLLTRVLAKGNKEGSYSLHSLNNKTTLPIIENVKLSSAAKIIWLRRVTYQN